MPLCHRCHEDKPPEDFYADSRRNTRISSRCKPCEAEYKRERYAANTEAEKARVSAWRAAHPEKARATDRARARKPR